MRYVLINISCNKRKVIPICEENFNKVYPLLCYKYSGTQEIRKPPSNYLIDTWRANNRARALCGCWVVGQARCEAHNKMSWLSAVYNLV